MYDGIRHVRRKQFVECYRTKVAFTGPIMLGVEWKSVTMEVINDVMALFYALKSGISCNFRHSVAASKDLEKDKYGDIGVE